MLNRRKEKKHGKLICKVSRNRKQNTYQEGVLMGNRAGRGRSEIGSSRDMELQHESQEDDESDKGLRLQNEVMQEGGSEMECRDDMEIEQQGLVESVAMELSREIVQQSLAMSREHNEETHCLSGRDLNREFERVENEMWRDRDFPEIGFISVGENEINRPKRRAKFNLNDWENLKGRYGMVSNMVHNGRNNLGDLNTIQFILGARRSAEDKVLDDEMKARFIKKYREYAIKFFPDKVLPFLRSASTEN